MQARLSAYKTIGRRYTMDNYMILYAYSTAGIVLWLLAIYLIARYS